MNGIFLKEVSKEYEGVKAVDGINLHVPDVSSVVILGPSGSGKTTLLRLISGLEMPDAGEIYLNDELVSRVGWAIASHRRRIGFMFQESALWPHMTVAQNILFGLHAMPRKDAHSRLKELLDKTGLIGFERRYPNQISGGEARRASLARTLAPRPKYVLLDEPLTSVDEDLKGSLISLIREEVRLTDACLAYVTHDAGEASKVSNRIVRLQNGCFEEEI